MGYNPLKKIGSDNYYVNYKDISGLKLQPFNEGNAYLSHLLFKFKYFDFDLRYWNSRGFIRPRGMHYLALFQKNISGLQKNIAICYLQALFTIRNFSAMETLTSGLVLIKILWKKISEPEYSYEMYFTYHLKIILTKIKNP